MSHKSVIVVIEDLSQVPDATPTTELFVHVAIGEKRLRFPPVVCSEDEYCKFGRVFALPLLQSSSLRFSVHYHPTKVLLGSCSLDLGVLSPARTSIAARVKLKRSGRSVGFLNVKVRLSMRTIDKPKTCHFRSRRPSDIVPSSSTPAGSRNVIGESASVLPTNSLLLIGIDGSQRNASEDTRLDRVSDRPRWTSRWTYFDEDDSISMEPVLQFACPSDSSCTTNSSCQALGPSRFVSDAVVSRRDGRFGDMVPDRKTTLRRYVFRRASAVVIDAPPAPPATRKGRLKWSFFNCCQTASQAEEKPCSQALPLEEHVTCETSEVVHLPLDGSCETSEVVLPPLGGSCETLEVVLPPLDGSCETLEVVLPPLDGSSETSAPLGGSIRCESTLSAVTPSKPATPNSQETLCFPRTMTIESSEISGLDEVGEAPIP